MRTESASSSLPSRFVEITKSLDSKFNTKHAEFFAENYTRLLRVLEVFETLPRNQNSKAVTSDLLPTFELNECDKEKVLSLCAKMRKIILATPDFDNARRVRLSNRISAIESEVHKEKGLFDVVLGGVSDLGETLGKFGKDIKPLSDRMAEITKLTRSATKEYDQIPAPDEVKLLSKADDEDTE